MDWLHRFFRNFFPGGRGEFLDDSLRELLASSPNARDVRLVLRYAKLGVIIGIVGMLVYCAAVSIAARSLTALLATLGVCFLLGGASFLIGGLLGFLFGIPRSRQDEAAAAAPGGAAPAGAPPSYRSNTNLEQISDWLTKILVGVGLTQLANVPELMGQLTRSLGTAIGPTPAVGGTFGTLTAVFFGVLGFLAWYLVTRLHLLRSFTLAEQVAREVNLLTNVRIDDRAVRERAGDMLSEAVDRIRAVPLAQLQSPEDFAAWAKAQNLAGQYTDAALGYAQALAQAPRNREWAIEATFNSLYEPPPDGFVRAIQHGLDFLQRLGDDARIHMYIAAAYGQKHRWNQEQGAPQDIVQQDRAKSLEHARKAVQLDPSTKLVLRELWDPSSPGKDPAENDLERFYGDPEFTALLGP
ncbi:MAG: hypothetical protein HYS13_21740 [Planctomycetia bacterium]|nr:hypothetical protein [Planctomycetia bacterium]